MRTKKAAPAEASSCPREDIGGQAVMEGVMMRAPRAIAIAVRRPDKSIVVKYSDYVPLKEKHAWMGYPFLRGIVAELGFRRTEISSSRAFRMDM